jgi:hypothetical protein
MEQNLHQHGNFTLGTIMLSSESGEVRCCMVRVLLLGNILNFMITYLCCCSFPFPGLHNSNNLKRLSSCDGLIQFTQKEGAVQG